MEKVRAHVGLGVDENVLRRAAGHQRLQNEAVAEVLGAGVQLAVGEGAGAALAELDIGGQVQLSCGPEPLHVRLPLFHRAAPLQQDGPLAGPGQHQSGEESGGPGPRHHGRDRRRRQGSGGRVDRLGDGPADLPAPDPAEHRRLILYGDLHRIDQADLLPGVHAAPQDPEGEEILLPHPQQAGGLGGQRPHAGLRRELDGIDS